MTQQSATMAASRIESTATAVWALVGAGALALANSQASVFEASAWCSVTGAAPLALGHCALCWSGALALAGAAAHAIMRSVRAR